MDLGKLWDDKATRVMIGGVSSPVWAPVVFALVFGCRFGVVWGAITALVRGETHGCRLGPCNVFRTHNADISHHLFAHALCRG